MKFEDGKGYWATNSVNRNQVVVVAAERKGGIVTFVKPSDLFSVAVGEFEGRETAMLTMADGVYHLSAAAVAPIAEAAKVVNTILKR